MDYGWAKLVAEKADVFKASKALNGVTTVISQKKGELNAARAAMAAA